MSEKSTFATLPRATRAASDQTDASRFRNRLNARTRAEAAKHSFHVVTHGLFGNAHLLSHLRSRVTASEKRERLACAWAEPWHAFGGWLDFFENLGESETSDHGAVGVLERNRTYGDAHTRPVSARDRHLQLCI